MGYWELQYNLSGKTVKRTFSNTGIRFIDTFVYELFSQYYRQITDYEVNYIDQDGNKAPLQGGLIRKWNTVLEFLREEEKRLLQGHDNHSIEECKTR